MSDNVYIFFECPRKATIFELSAGFATFPFKSVCVTQLCAVSKFANLMSANCPSFTRIEFLRAACQYSRNFASVAQLYAYSVVQYTNPRTMYCIVKICVRVSAATLNSGEPILYNGSKTSSLKISNFSRGDFKNEIVWRNLVLI
jgi:hypothetical protein